MAVASRRAAAAERGKWGVRDAFNRRHRRVGHLYQGRYKTIVIDRDNDLLELSRYVHLNPVRVRPLRERDFPAQVRHLEKYRWSSLAGYLDAQRKESWATYDAVGRFSRVGPLARLRRFAAEQQEVTWYSVRFGVKGSKTQWVEETEQSLVPCARPLAWFRRNAPTSVVTRVAAAGSRLGQCNERTSAPAASE